MKLPIIIAAGMLTASVSCKAYALTCGAQPSCDSLGYKYTGSATDCLGAPLKCPFNSSYFYCTKKNEALIMLQEDIITAAMPDYSKMQARSNNQTYTAATNGFIVGFDSHQHDAGKSSDSNTTNLNITINGKNVRVTKLQTNWSYNSWSYPIKKGAQYRISSDHSLTLYTYYFIPTI